MGELSDIEPDLGKHSSALELGCGTGRLCRRLQELGLRVTGVDESAEMLAHLPAGTEGIKASIESLNLGRHWPAVLLPSHLINHPEDSVRRHFARAARRHVTPTGTFYVKRHSPSWLSKVEEGPIGTSHGIALHAERVSRDGDLITMTIRYEAADASWTQTFTAYALERVQVEELLTACGFGSFRWLGSQGLWVAAAPSDA